MPENYYKFKWAIPVKSENKTYAAAQIDFSPYFYKVEEKISRFERKTIQNLGKLSGNKVNFSQEDEWIFWFKCVTYLPDRWFLICSFSLNPLPNLPCGPIWSHTHKLYMARGWKCLGILLYNFIKSYNFYILCHNVHISQGMLPSSYLRLKVSNIIIAILH